MGLDSVLRLQATRLRQVSLVRLRFPLREAPAS